MISFLQKQKQTLVTIGVTVIVMYSCAPPLSKIAKYGPVFENVMRSEMGIFRGFSLGNKIDSVQLKEPLKPIEADTDYLYYEIKPDSSYSYNITYNFDETGLDEIQSDIYINNVTVADDVFSKFKMYFDEHFGESQNHQGYTVWTVKSEKYGLIIINLSDESADYSADRAGGKISLWIYPDKD